MVQKRNIEILETEDYKAVITSQIIHGIGDLKIIIAIPEPKHLSISIINVNEFDIDFAILEDGKKYQYHISWSLLLASSCILNSKN